MYLSLGISLLIRDHCFHRANCRKWRTEDGWTTRISTDPPGRSKVKLTFSELNNKNHKIGGKLSVKTTVWFLEVVVCYNENKNILTLKYYSLFICLMKNYLYEVPEGLLFFPPHSYCCGLEINSYSWPNSQKQVIYSKEGVLKSMGLGLSIILWNLMNL